MGKYEKAGGKMNNLFLAPDHFRDLKRSELSDDTIKKAGIKSVSPDQINKKLGFNIPGLVSMYEIPFDDNYSRFRIFYKSGEELYKHGPDKGKKKPKYLAKKGSGNRLYIPAPAKSILNDVSIPLEITEGEKKALKACQEGLYCIAVTGLWGWKEKDVNELIECFNKIALNGRKIVLTPDNDWLKPNSNGEMKNLRQAVYKLAYLLIGLGAKVCWRELPQGKVKIGVDDYLCKYSMKEFKELPTHEINDLVDIVDNENKKTDKILIPLQPFPLEVFPESLVGIIERFSNSLGVDKEVIASSVLTIVSSAIGNTIRVSPKYGYEVPVFIWLIIIAISGYGKTPAISTLVRSVEKRQSKTYREYSEKQKKYKESLRKSKKSGDTEIVDEPILEHSFASDTTVEALGDIFESSPRGILIHRDELAGLILGLNQYKGGSGNDKQHYLELFNCKPWKIDRKTGVKFIHNVGSSIIGGIQTTIMPKVFNLDAIGEGLLPRFLLQNTEHKPRKFQRQGIEPDDLKLWEDILEKCYEISLTLNDNGFVEPRVLILGEEALNLFEEFHNNYTNLIPFLSDNAKPFVAKFITYSLKITGILHVLDCFSTSDTDIKHSIKAGTMDKAIRLTEYFAGQSINALELYGAKTKKELNEIESRLLETVFSLEGEVKNGKLALSRIREYLNTDLPEPLQCDSKQIGAMLHNQGLETKRGTNGYYYLLWDENKIKKLKATFTMSTTFTKSTNTHNENSQKVDIVDLNNMFSEDNVVNLESEEVEIIG